MSRIADAMIDIARRLRDDCEAIAWASPADYVYNPLVYAWAPYELYLRRYARAKPRAVLVGMNPGPNGMLQSGVPFGDVGLVRDWLGIEAEVGQPARLHPKRQIGGFAWRRGEASGRRVWGWARERFADPQAFFDRFFIANYCPLGFFDQAGTNVTPDKLRREQKDALFAVCDRALRATLELLQPSLVIGLGRFAEERAVAAAEPLGVPVAMVTHPSPANPRANAGWAPQMDATLSAAGIGLD